MTVVTSTSAASASSEEEKQLASGRFTLRSERILSTGESPCFVCVSVSLFKKIFSLAYFFIHLPSAFRALSLSDSTQLIAERATQPSGEHCPASPCCPRRCAEHVFASWLLYPLLITGVCVIVFTFILIILCLRPKTVSSHDAADFVLVFDLPGEFGKPGCESTRSSRASGPSDSTPHGTTRCSVLLPFARPVLSIPLITRENVTPAHSNLVLHIENINLV